MRKLLVLVAALLFALPVAAQPPVVQGTRIHLWANGAPGFESRKDIPEISEAYWTKPINNPSITYFPARAERRTGAAVLIMPGGAHEFLVITTEGEDVGRWFAERGIAAFVLRNRLFRAEKTPYTLEHSRQDAERAMRTIRARAAEFQVDAKRIGVVGFSAGAELARITALSPPVPAPGPGDAIDRLSSRPDFGILVFPGKLRTADERIAADSPPLLLSAASDDQCCSQSIIDLLVAYRAVGGSAELHMYAAGGHAYNMGERTPFVSLRNWPDRITDWMTDRGLLAKWPPAATP